MCQARCWLLRIQWGEKTDNAERKSHCGPYSPVDDGGHESQSPTNKCIMIVFSPVRENNMVQ